MPTKIVLGKTRCLSRQHGWWYDHWDRVASLPKILTKQPNIAAGNHGTHFPDVITGIMAFPASIVPDGESTKRQATPIVPASSMAAMYRCVTLDRVSLDLPFMMSLAVFALRGRNATHLVGLNRTRYTSRFLN